MGIVEEVIQAYLADDLERLCSLGVYAYKDDKGEIALVKVKWTDEAIKNWVRQEGKGPFVMGDHLIYKEDNKWVSICPRSALAGPWDTATGEKRWVKPHEPVTQLKPIA